MTSTLSRDPDAVRMKSLVAMVLVGVVIGYLAALDGLLLMTILTVSDPTDRYGSSSTTMSPRSQFSLLPHHCGCT